MTTQKGVDVGIQTESNWEDPKQRKYRRLKHKILEFIAKHKSAQSSVDKANRRVQVLQQEKRRLMRANKNGGIGNTIATGETGETAKIGILKQDADMMDEDDEVDQLVDEDEEMAGVSPSPKPRRVTGSRRKPIEVARDEDGKVILPVQIASLKVIDLGTVIHDRPGFHSERYIWPVGYTVERTYMSMVDAENQSTYTCKVEDGGDGPTFTIQAADAPDEEIISARTPTGAWATIIKRANEVRKRESANAISGPEYFGFSNPLVAEMIEALPNADECQYYVARSKR